jgi:hypothetical protein
MFLWLGTCPVWRKFFVYSINTCINFINYIMYTNCIKFLQHSVVQFFIYPKSINVTITVPSVQKIHLFFFHFLYLFLKWLNPTNTAHPIYVRCRLIWDEYIQVAIGGR